MVVHPVLQIFLLLWLIKAFALSCPHSCGNFSIFYPFGIGEGCYFDKWFEVTCDYSSGSPKPFLSSFNLELSGGLYMVSVDIPAISMNRSKIITYDEVINLSGSPFSFSNRYNKLTTIGCDNYDMINKINDSMSIDGCLSICTCDPTQQSGCYNFLCSIPPNVKFDNENIGILQECLSAFMVNQEWLESHFLTNPNILKDKTHAPARLEWGKVNGRCVEPYHSHTFCNEDNYCLTQLSSDYFCLCHNQRSDSNKGCTGDLVCNTTSGHSCSECPYGYEPFVFGYHEMQCSQRIYNDMLIKKSWVKFYIIIGCSAGLGKVLLIGTWWLYKNLKRRKAIKLRQKLFKRNGGLLLQQYLSSNKGNIEKIKLFTSKELEKATDNYNAIRILGQGGQGTVYKGMLAEGRIVAVKKSKMVDESKLEKFINEVVILSQINHRNVVQLLGCCLETEVPLLVFEFIPNGTLFQHLHDKNEEFPITWELRLRIAIEVAGALSYLHSAASIPIYHRDIKTTNILLDDKYRAKVSDFGISRSIAIDQTHLTTQVHGTFGYLDPEYFRSSQFTEKSDVYSFGVVLAELLTGQKPILSINFEESRSLAAYFLCAMKENYLFEILDARVLNEGGKAEIMTVANLTRRCLNLNGKKRPTMSEVAIELIRIGTSNRASIMLQSSDEIDCIDGNIINYFETGSSFTPSFS